MFFRAVLFPFPAVSTALEGFEVFPSSGTLRAVLPAPRVLIGTSAGAEAGYILRLSIINRDTFFARRKTLLVVFPEL
jgi:hypothetical protein